MLKIKTLNAQQKSEHKKKSRAHSLVARAIKQGLLTRQKCEAPKCQKQGHAHHDDYNKPLEVRWLCRSHHMRFHKNGNYELKRPRLIKVKQGTLPSFSHKRLTLLMDKAKLTVAGLLLEMHRLIFQSNRDLRPSRPLIDNWILGRSEPSDAYMVLLTRALKCRERDLRE